MSELHISQPTTVSRSIPEITYSIKTHAQAAAMNIIAIGHDLR